ALGLHPAVRHVVVIVREDVPGEKRIAAYVVPKGSTPSAGELQSHLKAKVPEYMVPSAFVMLESIPLTPNGKIDRKALPAPDHARGDDQAPFVAPRNPIEEVLAAIWEKALGVDRVGIHDNFFALGGHSLLAAQIIAQIRETFQVEIPLIDVFEYATIATFSP